MDKDGFYEGTHLRTAAGLVPSNLVEQIPDSDIQGCLPTESLDREFSAPGSWAGPSWKDDPVRLLTWGKPGTGSTVVKAARAFSEVLGT